MDVFGFCCSRKSGAREQNPVPTQQRRGVPDLQRSSASNPATPTKGNLGGLGIVFQAGNTTSGLTVASLAVDGPADKRGQVISWSP